ncbi:NAD(P)/FAD-dependent oxidoreductase [Flavobacterium subsaxonicum]|uniref:Pyridine nucleotide-disulfide oxidoreductase n=1 Tax=Flavobacterium subsaxonicum WB 4.1-42 = DSM 21790 TaxID=1121898 RepID=A0A0A2MIB3_9FLAO|nr:NAD(P)/FAD-dependent oxidoreductase [Flavobacterium subsaxonicum]KGO91326.1 pyridine nucleotide-disulfide oxidoreductase [Flavobacterium subsaxonicum WB 4.1-42 = DSM 21790]
MLKENVDVLVIGAGPSGCVAASYLHNNGVKIKVVERSKFPRFVIGESLIPRVMDHFDEAGLLDALKAMDFEKKFGARFIRGEELCVFDFSQKFGEGWDWTWQVPRADFDNTLAQEVIKKGIDLEFETEVLDVVFNGSDSVTTIRDKEGVTREVHAKFIIDSSGYGRVLPRILKLDAPSSIPENSSMFAHVKDVNRPEGVEGTQITFDILETKVWLWVIPFSNGNTSIGVVGPTSYIKSLGDNTTEALKEVIKQSDFYRDRFEGVDFLFEPHKIENYSCSVTRLCGPGYSLTGNSSEFLDPVFSSGVCFATESGMLSAKLFLRELNGETVDWDTEYTAYMRRGVDVFATYVKEWYTGNLQTLFFHRPENPDVKQKICSVLAGYVWDEENPFVKKHDRVIKSMAYMLQNEQSAQ